MNQDLNADTETDIHANWYSRQTCWNLQVRHVQNPVQNKFNNLEDDHLTRTDGHNISDQFIVGSFIFLPLF
jgi:hypothetical protein